MGSFIFQRKNYLNAHNDFLLWKIFIEYIKSNMK